MTNPTSEQYRIRFSFIVEFTDMSWGIEYPDSWSKTAEIILWKDQPMPSTEDLQEKACAVVKQMFWDVFNLSLTDYKINSITVFNFYKEEKLEELDYVKKF